MNQQLARLIDLPSARCGLAGELLLDAGFDVLIDPGKKRLHHSIAVSGPKLTVHLGRSTNVLSGSGDSPMGRTVLEFGVFALKARW